MVMAGRLWPAGIGGCQDWFVWRGSQRRYLRDGQMTAIRPDGLEWSGKRGEVAMGAPCRAVGTLRYTSRSPVAVGERLRDGGPFAD
jgi:hypothetical protein